MSTYVHLHENKESQKETENQRTDGTHTAMQALFERLGVGRPSLPNTCLCWVARSNADNRLEEKKHSEE